jgi:hypothetical protein
MTIPNQAFRQAANSPAGREVHDAAKSAAETARDLGDSLSKAGDFASDVSHRAGREFGRARDAAAETWDEFHDASERNPHVTLLVAFGLGFLFGIVAASRR